MLSGVKLISRDQVDRGKFEESSESKKDSRKSSSKKEKSRRKKKGSEYSSSDDDGHEKIRKRSRKKKWYSSDEYSDSESDEDDSRGRRKQRSKGKEKDRKYEDSDVSDEAGGSNSTSNIDIVRKEMGLDWMCRPAERAGNSAQPAHEEKPLESGSEEMPKKNPRELNPYLRDNGSGYPEDEDQTKSSSDQLLSSSVVGDGGASWRMKALKRAQEQAAREGRNVKEVVQERWGSLGHLAVSVASHSAAAPRAHLHAIKSRRMGAGGEAKSDANNESKRGIEKHKKAKGDSQDALSSKSDTIREANSDSVIKRSGEDKQPPSANQLAAKAMQLRLKGKHEEAEKLLREAENNKVDHDAGERLVKLRNDVSSSRYVVQEKQLQQKGREDDGDRHLAQTIMKNQKYSLSTQADDEYDFDGAPAKKSKRKGADNDNRSHSKQNVAKRIVTQQERCQFCFENPKRPKHLVVAIANFTYLMLPQFQPVAPGHCCISTLQHELATRMVDDNVWEEIRNFKKCLIMMAAKQDKEMIFLETVLWLAQQRRHCLIECIPLPKDIAKEAPLYFKKAIDEAEDEWSQHNAKKLIDTSQKGLRGSIPKNFPYFHVEFGLSRGFVHVIDDETEFKSSFGLNVIRGMLQSQDENMYRRRQYESIEVQKEAVAAFARDWEPFNWTKQLE